MANNIVPFPRQNSNTDAFLASLTATDLLEAADYAEASKQAELLKLELFESLLGTPEHYFVQLARDDRNAPLIRAGEIVVVDQGGPQRGGWLPVEGGLYVIEYNGGLNDYPNQRYPRVTQDIVQTFTDDKGRWWAGGLQKSVVGNTFYADCGPYNDTCDLAHKLVGRVVGILAPTMMRAAA